MIPFVGWLLAVPVLSMRTGIADDGVGDPSTTYRQAYDLMAEGFGEGFNGPLTVVVDSGELRPGHLRARKPD